MPSPQHEMNLYRRYFDLVAAERKTIEVRVQYPKLRKLKAGDHIRFVCGRDDVLTRIKRIARYASFEEMLDAEGPANVNPDSPRDQQLADIRRIYGHDKEALGVLAIEIEIEDDPRWRMSWPDPPGTAGLPGPRCCEGERTGGTTEPERLHQGRSGGLTVTAQPVTAQQRLGSLRR